MKLLFKNKMPFCVSIKEFHTARFFIGFTNEESCGKCVPCREGLQHMLMILDKILSGKPLSSRTSSRPAS